VIAIDGELETDRSPAVHLPLRYATAVYRAGGLPLVLPPIEEERGAREGTRYVDELLAAVDGLLLAGGDDFDTEALGLGPTHPDARPVPATKQAFDFALARAALVARVPVLGVCYGMQVLALAEGGGLWQHLPEDRPGSREHRGGALHDVELAPESKLRALLGVARVSVVSRHHQALSAVGPDWAVTGSDDEGLIEAVERTGHPFALGVQWHPELDVAPEDPRHARERLAAGEVHAGLFRGLVEAASAHQRVRMQRMRDAQDRGARPAGGARGSLELTTS